MSDIYAQRRVGALASRMDAALKRIITATALIHDERDFLKATTVVPAEEKLRLWRLLRDYNSRTKGNN